MENKKRKYAKFLIEGCLRLKQGDKLFIIGYDLINDFIDIISEEAKKLGITDIEYLINNPEKQRELYLNNTYEEIIANPIMDRTKFNRMAKEGYAFLSLSSTLPDYYKDVDSKLLSKVSTYQMKSIEEYKHYQHKGLIKWNISCVPNKIWADNLGMSLDDLWNLIFDICLINEDNPVATWDNKMEKLAIRAKYLNDLDIDYLVYENRIGTNIKIGLPKGYLFQSADGQNIVNMPTEEVFTSPDRLRVNGKVYSSKVLIHNNKVINNFWLEFRDGKVIDYDALCGKEVLKGIMDTDEGASFLGEVALVDFDSPISKSGVVFKNTLYDENASCHLALGASFAECIKGGLEKNNDELLKMGLNYSHTHVDFFIGTSDLKITAYLQNGDKKVIMENGNFKER